jgi:hypothetical protein
MASKIILNTDNTNCYNILQKEKVEDPISKLKLQILKTYQEKKRKDENDMNQS